MTNESEKRKSERPGKGIDIGLAILSAILPPGESVSIREIAAFCDCTPTCIWLIERRALQKLKKRLHVRQDTELADLVEQVVGKTIGPEIAPADRVEREARGKLVNRRRSGR